MARTRRGGFNRAESDEMWTRWKAGESVSDIARALVRPRSSVHWILAARGGIPPRKPHRNVRCLSAVEREEISRGIAQNATVRAIAKRLGRSPSTISREITRNGGRENYRAEAADRRAWDTAHRPQECKLGKHPALRDIVAEKLCEDWSPQQIAGWLMATNPDDPTRQVSHETIYLTLFVQARGALRRELMGHLRRVKALRRPHTAVSKSRGQGQIVDAVSIRERPPDVEDRAVPGHWEGDLIFGSAHTYVATLVERTTRFVLLVKVDSKDTRSVTQALSRKMCQLPGEIRRSLTWDRGHEMAAHVSFSVATDIQVYFCDPQSPWQRGSNENTNGLLRQYLPKKANISLHSQADLDAIALKLNTRPRMTLGFATPAAKLEEVLR